MQHGEVKSSSLATLGGFLLRNVLDGFILGAALLALLLLIVHLLLLLLEFALLDGLGLLALLLLIVHLLLLLLEFALLDGLGLLGKLSITVGILLSALTLDVFKAHSDDGLLDAGGLASLLTLDNISLDLLVETAPSLGPRKLHRLNSLVVQRSRFRANE